MMMLTKRKASNRHGVRGKFVEFFKRKNGRRNE